MVVNEGQTATNTGTFADPGDDTVSLSASVGTVTPPGRKRPTGSMPSRTARPEGERQQRHVELVVQLDGRPGRQPDGDDHGHRQ